MVHLAASEGQRDLHLVALGQEVLHLAGLGVEVAPSDLRAVLHLLDDDVAGLAAGLLGLLRRLVLELAVVHDAADGRVRLGGDLDEVEIELPGEGEGFGQRLDADLLPVVSHQSDLSSPDPIVDPGLAVGRGRGYRRILFM